MNATRFARIFAFAWLVVAPNFATLAAAKPRVHALVSAVGSQIGWVRQNNSAGTHIPYYRHTVAVPNTTVDAAVLRGLDRAVASEDPDSQRIFLRISPEAIRDVRPYQRHDIVPARALAALQTMAEGARLHGIGVYVQPLGRNIAGTMGDSADLDTSIDYDTVSPDGEKGSSYRFGAPYFYTQLWIIDAKTLKVLEKKERYDYQRIHDPSSNELSIDRLGAMMEGFVERAAARAVNEQIGEVTVKEPRVVNPSEVK